mgnify:CR=1 FL=1
MSDGGGFDYARTYWLLYLGVGLLFGVQGVLDYAVTGAVTLDVALPLLVALLIAAVSVYALREPGKVSAPQRPDLLFVVAVIAFFALVVLTSLRLLAL